MTFILRSAWKKLVWWRDEPPNLDEIFRDLQRKFGKNKRPSGDSVYRISPNKTGGGVFAGPKIIIWVVLFLWFISGILVVQAPENAVVLRLGKYNRTLEPGPHWIPRILETYKKENIQRIQEFTYGSEMLTRDENIVYVSLSIQYRITNLSNYLFNVVSPVASLQQATASALRQVAGHTSLDEILTTGRGKARNEIEGQLNNILDIYKTGIEVTDVNLQPAKPPEQVTDAFDDAIKAREDEQRYINLATASANRKVERANGQAMRIAQDADGYYQKIIKGAEADTARFNAQLAPYHAYPDIVKARIYFDVLQDVYQRVQKVLIDSGGKQDGKIIYLPIEQMLKNAARGSQDSDGVDSEINKGVSSESYESSENSKVTTNRGLRNVARQGYR